MDGDLQKKRIDSVIAEGMIIPYIATYVLEKTGI